jgi:hypothetical protein
MGWEVGMRDFGKADERERDVERDCRLRFRMEEG